MTPSERPMIFQWFYTDVRDIVSSSFIITPSQYMVQSVLHEEIEAKRKRALISMERQETACAKERGWGYSTLLSYG